MVTLDNGRFEQRFFALASVPMCMTIIALLWSSQSLTHPDRRTGLDDRVNYLYIHIASWIIGTPELAPEL